MKHTRAVRDTQHSGADGRKTTTSETVEVSARRASVQRMLATIAYSFSDIEGLRLSFWIGTPESEAIVGVVAFSKRGLACEFLDLRFPRGRSGVVAWHHGSGGVQSS